MPNWPSRAPEAPSWPQRAARSAPLRALNVGQICSSYNSSRPCLRSQRSASRHSGHTDATSRQKARE